VVVLFSQPFVTLWTSVARTERYVRAGVTHLYGLIAIQLFISRNSDSYRDAKNPGVLHLTLLPYSIIPFNKVIRYSSFWKCFYQGDKVPTHVMPRCLLSLRLLSLIFAPLRETLYKLLYLSIKETSMNRRYLLKGMGAIVLYSSFPTILSEFLSSCKTKDNELRAGFFSDDEFHLIEGITDALLPATSTPGALDAKVPFFLDLVIKNCLTKEDQQLIKKGLQQMNEQEKFSSLSSTEKLNAIKKVDEAAFKDDAGSTWFRIVKKLSLIGYFTSQEGMTKALNYVKVPGDYKGCIPYKQGEKALAKTFLMYW